MSQRASLPNLDDAGADHTDPDHTGADHTGAGIGPAYALSSLGARARNDDRDTAGVLRGHLGAAILGGADPADIVGILGQVLGRELALLDSRCEPRASSGNSETLVDEWDDRLTRHLSSILPGVSRPSLVPVLPGCGLLGRWVGTPISAGEETFGYLLVRCGPEGDEQAEADGPAVSCAAELLGLALAGERTTSYLRLRSRAAAVEALVSGNALGADLARAKARELSIGEGQLCRVVLLRWDELPGSDGGSIQSAPSTVREAVTSLAERAPDVAVSVRASEVVAVVPVRSDNCEGQDHAEAGAMRVLECFTGILPGPSRSKLPVCGISEPATLPDRAGECLAQAEQAIAVGRQLGRHGRVIDHGMLGIYRLLLHVGDMRTLRQFAEDTLGPLLRYEDRHGTELIRTLSVYLNERESLKQTARRLRVHTNTVSYRIQRIGALTSLDLADSNQRLAAHVAAKIIDLERSYPVT